MALRQVIAALLLTTSFSAIAAEVSGLRVWTDPDKTRVVLDLDQKIEYSLFTLEQPHRVVIDLKSADFKASTEVQSEYSGVIKGVRLGQPKDGTLRVVFDLDAEVNLKSFLLAPTAQYGHRLVLDMFPPQAASHEPVRPVQSLQNQEREVVVAIDAGHGGEDPGAIGKNRTREKDVVLQIARRLQDVINSEPGMRAVMVRDGDYYIPLRTRYEKARQQRADLFVSIHADAFRNSDVRGSSVFVLSQRGASSEFARLVADAENASDLVGGVSLNDKDDVLASVLLDL
jgi:N-acetylmuramoyl-L-alanine amidase